MDGVLLVLSNARSEGERQSKNEWQPNVERRTTIHYEKLFVAEFLGRRPIAETFKFQSGNSCEYRRMMKANFSDREKHRERFGKESENTVCCFGSNLLRHGRWERDCPTAREPIRRR